MRRIKLLVAGSIPALVAGMLLSPAALAQTAPSNADTPSVGVQPLGGNPSDPNAGQWFILTGNPGATVRATAHLTNPAQVDQQVKLYLADLDFDRSGSPQIADVSDDVGTWGAFENGVVTVPARGNIDATFHITVPSSADPGDHVGVVMAEGQPLGEGDIRILKRVATRMYVTVPGDAVPDYTIQSVTTAKDSSFLTREMTVAVTLRNNGRVRLQPSVTVNGKKASGSQYLMSRSLERYLVTVPVPLWGGPQRYRVDVQTKVGLTDQNGPVKQARASAFIFPWLIVVSLAGMALLLLSARLLLRRRGGKYAEMRADMKRIERLLAEQRSGAPIDTRDDDPEIAIKAAIKRAGRAGDKESEEKLKEKLAEHRAVAPPEPEPEPVVATTPPPAPEPVAPPAVPDEPAPATAGSSTYDWLLEDSPPVSTEGPNDFYDSLRDAAEPAEPPRTPVQSAMGPGYFVPDAAPAVAPSPAEPEGADEPEPEPEPVVATAPRPEPASHGPVPSSEQVDTLAAVLRELKTASKKRQEALLTQARSYGVLTLRAHADLIDELPPEVKVKLLPKQWAI